MFLFYTPLGVALVVIYICPIVGMLLTRLAPQERFGKYTSIVAAATMLVMLVACFAFLPLILYTVETKYSSKVQSNQTHAPHMEDISDQAAYLGLYYLGFGMALLISVSDASHKIILGYLFGNASTNSTILTAYLAGFGGIIVGLIAAVFDKNQKLLSGRITSISTQDWGLLIALALVKLVTFLTISYVVKFIRPFVVFLMEYRKEYVSK